VLTAVFAVLFAAALIAVIVLLAGRAEYRAYRVEYPYNESDLEAARQQSVRQSRSVLNGQTLEQIAPYLPDLLDEFNPADARFLGQPVDYVIFDGDDEGHVERVVFVEVKTGRSTLSGRQREIKAVVESHQVEFRTVRLPGVTSAPPRHLG
jgi:predicted Holliday junction resolvase-like endonuclease